MSSSQVVGFWLTKKIGIRKGKLLPTETKKKTVKELNEIFLQSKSAVLANYQGISAPELSALRLHMKNSSVKFFVTKNTLARVAAKGTSFEVLESDFKEILNQIQKKRTHYID